jgi:hypothetical protein
MIFPHIELEPVIQLNDRTRLNATKSFVTQDESAITKIEIKPITGESFIDVTTDQYLDWQYSSAGTVNVTCRVTASAASAEITSTMQVISPASDNLFSSDSDLKLHEPDIMKWTENGRNSFKNMHRRVQKLIVEQLRREGYVDINGVPYTKGAIVNLDEVKQWSTFWVLETIMQGMSNSVDDEFDVKAKEYKKSRLEWGKTAMLRLDTDGDGVADSDEGIDTAFPFVARR